MDIAGLLDDMKERVRTRGATPLVGGGLLGSFTRGLLGLDPSEEDSKFSQDMMLKAYQTGQALSNTPTPLALAVAPAAIAKAGKAAKARKVKVASDDVYEVMEANFNYGKLAGNKTMPIEKLSGGVRMDDPKEASRVKALAAKIASPEGYVSRLIVDDAGNVIEGQHRLEALRMLGDKDVPVTVIQDLSNKYNVQAMERAIEKTLHPDQVDQMVKRAIDVLEEAGSKEKALSQYQMPGRFKKTFEDAIAASSFKKPLPREEALETARKNAVEMLGLPENNTAMDRARAMGFDTPAVHFSRHGVDVRELDSSKFAIAPFDAVGTHVGSPQAAMERFQNTVGYKVNNPSYGLDELKGATYPVVIRKGKEFLSGDKPWNEDALSAELRKRGGHNWADVNRGGQTYSEMNEALRQKLFQEYGAIPYINDVEAKGQISYIVPPKNIRSRFAAFDPKRINDRDLLASLAAFGVGIPTYGLLEEE